VENLLDSHYEEVSGYNTPGIAAFAGVKLTFGGPDGLSWVK
jgi:outer membrane cobalamin receptor